MFQFLINDDQTSLFQTLNSSGAFGSHFPLTVALIAASTPTTEKAS